MNVLLPGASPVTGHGKLLASHCVTVLDITRGRHASLAGLLSLEIIAR